MRLLLRVLQGFMTRQNEPLTSKRNGAIKAFKDTPGARHLIDSMLYKTQRYQNRASSPR